MAKAKHPKLRWKENDGGDRVAGLFTIVQSISRPGLLTVFKRSVLLAYVYDLNQAKAIAQAFADSETLRGEGG